MSNCRAQNDSSRVRALRLARLASSQDGVVDLRQLEALGLERSWAHTGVRNGRLHELHDGVWAVGHTALTVRGLLRAAVMACGEQAALTHTGSCVLWGFLEWDPDRRPGMLARGADAERQALLEADGERVLRVFWEHALTRPGETLRGSVQPAPRSPRHPTERTRPARPSARRRDVESSS